MSELLIGTNSVAAAWEAFDHAVIPEDAPAIQRREMKRAFYAGIYASLQLVGCLNSPQLTIEAGSFFINALHQECREFSALVERGLA